MKKSILLLAVSIGLLSACTIQKRHYLPGYSVHLNKKYKSAASNQNEKGGNSEKLAAENLHNLKIASAKPLEKEVELASTFLQKKSNVVTIHSNEEKAIAVPPTSEKRTITDEKAQFKTKPIQAKSISTPLSTYKNEQEKSDQTALYAIALLMGLTTAGAVIRMRKTITKITRWAKQNPKKAQVLIAGIQVPLIAGSIVSGYNLRMLGFEFSDVSMYIFGGLSALSFASLPFLPKSENVVLQKTVNKKRMAVMGASLSTIMLLAGFGNRVNETHPASFVGQTIESVDQSLFSDNNLDQTLAKNNNSQSDNEENKRKGAIGGFVVLGVFLTILLAAAVCGGICLAASGGGAGLVFLGVIIAALAIIAIIFMWKSVKRKIRELKTE